MSLVHEYILLRLWYSNMNPDKIICPCHKVKKGDIAHAIEKGATSFKDVKKELRTVEQFIFKTFESKKLDSIVVQIVRAIEDKRPKKVYKAPFMQAKLVKIYSMFKS